MLLRRKRSKKGQTLVEYALILAFISLVAISVLVTLGRQVNTTFSKVNSDISAAGASH